VSQILPLPLYSRIKETVDFIRARCRRKPVLGLILGSGLGAFADSFGDRVGIPFRELPHFPIPTVPGHPGNLIAGNVQGVSVVALQGRAHLYEGYSLEEVAFPARVLGSLGIRRLIVTNAAGGINKAFHPGDLMLITDHINLSGSNPLIGPNIDELGPRFPDLSEAYDSEMRGIVLKVAREKTIPVRQGIYIWFHGPSFETPAEIRMCRTLGADAVGMSTIPEVIIANHMGIPVLGISCITNMAAGISPRKLAHDEVMNTARTASQKLRSLLQGIIPLLADLK
jgi:purine-nucleoside phosphorylase